MATGEGRRGQPLLSLFDVRTNETALGNKIGEDFGGVAAHSEPAKPKAANKSSALRM